MKRRAQPSRRTYNSITKAKDVMGAPLLLNQVCQARGRGSGEGTPGRDDGMGTASGTAYEVGTGAGSKGSEDFHTSGP